MSLKWVLTFSHWTVRLVHSLIVFEKWNNMESSGQIRF